MKVTRDVVSDLWPVYESGEASADTKALVEEFLAQDAAFAATLRANPTLPATEVHMSHDSETVALKRTRDLVHGRGWLRGVRLLALALTALAIVHLFTGPSHSATSRVIGEGVGAIVVWAAYSAGIYVERRRALRV